MNRVKIGTCSGPAEAAFVRSVFDAHGVPVVINGEMHAAVMGGLGGFVGLEIYVDAEDAEDAAGLLRDIRAGEHAVSEDDDLSAAEADDAERPARPDDDERDDAHGIWDARRGSHAASTVDAVPPPAAGFDTRRRRTGIVLVLSTVAGFGTAHMSTGAWKRGFAIAAITVVGFAYLAHDRRVAGWLLFVARFADLFGALWRVWSQPDDRKAT